jgi:hypothetical protein
MELRKARSAFTSVDVVGLVFAATRLLLAIAWGFCVIWSQSVGAEISTLESRHRVRAYRRESAKAEDVTLLIAMVAQCK